MTPGLARASTVPQLLQALAASDPGRPRLTWYDDAAGPTRGERIELSARVLATWVAKAANLLVDELDVSPGDRVTVELPTHWRAAYWLLAAWSAGAEVVVGDPSGDPVGSTASGVTSNGMVVITDRPASAPPGSQVVAVTLPALARSWAGAPLPDGAVDEAASVTGQPDVFEPVGEPDADSPALTFARRSVSYGDLLVRARAVGHPDQARVLVSTGPGDAIAGLLAPLVVDGSVVLVRDPDPALLGERRQAERVTSV